MEVRLARPTDADAIRRIYNDAVETVFTFDLRARTLEEQVAWLIDRSGAYAAIVAVDGPAETGEVVGFASLSPYRGRPAYKTTAEDSVYVDESARGRGVGHMLLNELLEVALGSGFHSVIARVVAGNESSIALHEKAGFEHVGVEREVGRKFRRWLDVVCMQKLLTAHEPED